MARILVLGGSGFIGSNLLSELLEAGHHITNFDRPGTSPQAFEKLSQYRFVPGNLADSSHLRSVFEQQPFDKVVFLVSTLIPSSGYSEFLLERDINLTALYEVVRHMETTGCPEILFFSSGGTVYGNNGLSVNAEDSACCPLTYYGYSKLASEEYIRFISRGGKIRHTIVRPSNPYGSGQNQYGRQGLIAVAMGKILQKRPVEVWGDGEVVRDYLHISDLISAICLLLALPFNNEVYNIGSGQGTSVNTILSKIGQVAGYAPDIHYTPARSVDIPVNILDFSKIRSVTGWQPKIGLDEGLRSLWSEMQLSS